MSINYFKTYKNNYKKYDGIKSVEIINNQPKDNFPFLTIAIPTYKRLSYLERAITSALNQKAFDNYEIVVVDNDMASSFKTKNMVESLKSKKIKYYVNEKNIGMFGNWNRCIELSRGEWITILNDDDLLKPNYLREVTKIIIKYRIINCLYVDAEIKKNDLLIKKIHYRKTKGYLYKFRTFDFYLKNQSYGSLGIIFKKELAKRIGGFDDDMYPSSDYFFFVKYLLKYNFMYKLNENLAVYNLDINESMKEEVRFCFFKHYLKMQAELYEFLFFAKWVHFIFAKEISFLFKMKSNKFWNNEYRIYYSNKTVVAEIIIEIYRYIVVAIRSFEYLLISKKGSKKRSYGKKTY